MTATPGPRPLVHVVGARPNFVKAAPVIRALAEAGVAQRVVHTGQHYDEALSGVFFAELDLPAPDLNLGVGSGSHARQTAALLVALEEAFESLSPALVIDYGDVNSTLAAALVAAKLHLPQAHVEAGLRSFDMSMPEEVNRRVADAFADLCFATSADAVDNLRREGVPAERIHLVGNSMIDSLEAVRPRLDPAGVRAVVGLPDGPYGVVTLHRPGNVDEPARTRALVDGLAASAAQVPLAFPVHPRGRAALEAAGLTGVSGLHLVEPLGYLAFLSLVAGSAVVITDSGGVQEETTILGVPCLTVRPNTERPVTITHGTNRLIEPRELAAAVGAVVAAATALAAGPAAPLRPPARPPLWDGRAGERIAAVLVEWLRGRTAGSAP
jgi:UDP-N-acetylglucosamine 2-epimerase (non-hydrolysing)